jgi:hypothetical protein
MALSDGSEHTADDCGRYPLLRRRDFSRASPTEAHPGVWKTARLGLLSTVGTVNFQPGDYVDWYRDGQSERWHGVVISAVDERVDVHWLMSDTGRSHVPTGTSSRPHYYRGYVTSEHTDHLRHCADFHGELHPSRNPWGRRYGIPS